MEFTTVATADYHAFAEAASVIGSRIPQIPLDQIEATAKGIYTVAFRQPDSVKNMFTFAFVGLEVFTGLISAFILRFINVEKTIDKEQAEIKARHAEGNAEATESVE